MAESQGGFVYSAQATGTLQVTISSERFARYLAPATNATSALQWYLFNARLAKSLLFPLHIFEVSLRNAFDRALTLDYGPNWPWNGQFNAALTQEGTDAVQKAISHSIRKKTSPTTHDVVTELTLDFWANLFRPSYSRSKWTARFGTLFPNANGLTVRDIGPKVVKINELRNRIAHHEPIFDSPRLIDRYNDLLQLLNAQNSTIHDWVKHHSTFNRMRRTKPTSSGIVQPTTGEQCDRNFTTKSSSEKLSALGAPACILCANEVQQIVAVILMSDIASYALDQANKDGYLIDFSEHSFDDVIKHGSLLNNFIDVDEVFAMSDLAHEFKHKNKQVALVRGKQNNILGYILRAHRRY